MYGVIPEEVTTDIKLKNSSCIFFILGAGASVDSGLGTYRGPEGIYTNSNVDYERILSHSSSLKDMWEFLEPLYTNIKNNLPGPTYQKIKEMGALVPDSFILTQNIDGYALSIGLPVIEIHGSARTMTCLNKLGCGVTVAANCKNYKCTCGSLCRPDIVLFDEKLSQIKVHEVYRLIKRCPTHVIVIGTSLQFPYLREFITKAKQRGAKVIHINPDVSAYADKLKKGEIWYNESIAKGLDRIIGAVVNNRDYEE